MSEYPGRDDVGAVLELWRSAPRSRSRARRTRIDPHSFSVVVGKRHPGLQPISVQGSCAALLARRATFPSQGVPQVDWTTVLQSIVIGVAGGAGAGLTVWTVRHCHERRRVRNDKEVIHTWLREHTATVNELDQCYRPTRYIASWTNLPEDRVRYICSIDERIFLSTGHREEQWTLREVRERLRR